MELHPQASPHSTVRIVTELLDTVINSRGPLSRDFAIVPTTPRGMIWLAAFTETEAIEAGGRNLPRPRPLVGETFSAPVATSPSLAILRWIWASADERRRRCQALTDRVRLIGLRLDRAQFKAIGDHVDKARTECNACAPCDLWSTYDFKSILKRKSPQCASHLLARACHSGSS